VLDHPFAWVVSPAAVRATPLPLRPVLRDGEVVALLGHFARSNPQVEALRRDPRALILFLGPHGYVSPSWMADRTQAPTWNYASAQFVADLAFVEDEAGLDALMRDLIGAVEEGRDKAWALEDMGPRYRSLSRGIVGFRAEVVETRAKFKLGQDERVDVFPDIMAGVEREGMSELHAWMAQFNEWRD
jgi:predicted FMN-binding regulatory protein PaiB